MFKKKNIIWAIITFAIIGGGYYFLRPKAPVTIYTTADAEKRSLKQTVSATGTLNPDKQYDLAFKTSGTVIEMNVDVGDRVKKRQRLAQIDKGTLVSQLRRAEAQLEAEKQTLSDMKDKRDTFSKDQRDAQRAAIKAAKAGVGIVRDQLRDTNIYSPVDGIVLKRFANVGDATFVNTARSASILVVAEEGDLIIRSNIPESDIAKIKTGQKVRTTFDALVPDETFEGLVFEIDPAATVIQDVVYYQIKIKLEKIDERLMAGMSASIDIATAEKENVLMIPLRAVKAENGRKFVEVLADEKNNIIEKKYIETGLEGDEGLVEIKSGLKEGEKVVTFTKTQ